MPSFESEMDDPFDPFNPIRQPERVLIALAKGAMPVLIDRLGGTVAVPSHIASIRTWRDSGDDRLTSLPTPERPTGRGECGAEAAMRPKS